MPQFRAPRIEGRTAFCAGVDGGPACGSAVVGDPPKKSTDSRNVCRYRIEEGRDLMSRDGKGWLLATFGIALLTTAMLARAWRNGDEAPPTAISDSWESIDFHPKPAPVRHQPTVLQADAAISPLSGAAAPSPIGDHLSHTTPPPARENFASGNPPSPSDPEPVLEEFLPFPPAHQLRQP